MKKRIVRESTETYPGFRPRSDEQVLFCGHTTHRMSNPLDANTKHPETVVLTNQRLVALAKIGVQSEEDAVTAIPLGRIDSIQYTYLRWTALRVLGCVLGFIFYVIPGVIYLVHMIRSVGPRVNVVAGTIRVEVKFADPELMSRFVHYLQWSVA